MQHHPYAKIPESLRALQLDEAAYRQLSRVEWVVTEKVHGANFCILVDAHSVRFAKRKEILAPEEDFFGHLLLQQDLRSAANIAFHLQSKNISELRIYGEIFGGAYPHPEVPADPRVEPVQTGIYYHPSVQFCCFDLGLINDKGDFSFLDFDLLQEVCSEAGLFCLPPLLRGNLTQAMEYPLNFPTGVPRHYGLPELPDNLAEGVVIKPATSLILEGKKGAFRPVIKRKIPRFAEDERFHQAEAWTAQTTRQVLVVDEKFWEGEVLPLFTRARLQSAISKIGRMSPRTRSRIAKELAEDVLAEIRENFPDLTTEDLAQLSERIGMQAGKLSR